ncbi:hypothetical protein BIV57_13885 [Mangrovactinospora gilvigrisea]|uniref:DUF3159 domain-containing protein n=1 Tax=Mangrovactinospora gilvigrisea TaxID=1428644 RepID=A0A1J7BEA0_9ACTN|nr:VC0807 family protein [Mangrovactinospora gilvigrisea]OIV36901.1 hypothetical protein BIV57_13885 [Mangrovactinospora gilvigrisea]
MTSTQQPATASRGANARKAFLPLLIDVGLPVGGYYLLADGFGLSSVTALIISSIPPALSAVWAAVKQHRFNGLATLIVAVNIAGIITSILTGNARLMLAKDALVTSTLGVAILVSALVGRPLMSSALRPMIARGRDDVDAAWRRLRAGESPDSRRFRRAEAAFSLVWGVVLVADCIIRVVLAFSVPVHTAVGAQTIVLLVALGIGIAVGRFFVPVMGRLIREERERGVRPEAAPEAAAST